MGLLPHAAWMPRSTLSRSKGTRDPSFFTTTSRAVFSTRSYVVKRFPQSTHSRRLRIVPPDSAARLSITLSLSRLQ